MKTTNVMSANAITMTRMTTPTGSDCGAGRSAAEREKARGRARQFRDDAGEDDERDAIADAARRDLLAEPQKEHDAADQRDDRGDEEEGTRIGDDRHAAA